MEGARTLDITGGSCKKERNAWKIVKLLNITPDHSELIQIWVSKSHASLPRLQTVQYWWDAPPRRVQGEGSRLENHFCVWPRHWDRDTDQFYTYPRHQPTTNLTEKNKIWRMSRRASYAAVKNTRALKIRVGRGFLGLFRNSLGSNFLNITTK